MPLVERNYTGDRHSVIPRGYQALIPSYRFNCSGNITEWLIGLASQTVESIEIELQVWRPVNNSGLCFNKVGGNIFTVLSKVQVANLMPTKQIEFQSGDVVGFRLLNSSQAPSPTTVTEGQRNRNVDRSRDEDEKEGDPENGTNDENDKEVEDDNDDNDDDDGGNDDDDDDDDGVVILNEVNNITPNEEVWFSRIGDAMSERDFGGDRCALSIGSNGMLTTFTNAAPLISASVLVVEQNLQVPQGVTVSAPAPQDLSPITVEEESSDVLILVSSTTVPAIFIVVLLSIIVAVVCTCHRAKRRNHSMPAMNDDAEQRTVLPIVYRREIVHSTSTNAQNQTNVGHGVLRIAPLTPHGHGRAQNGNPRSANSTNREDQLAVRPSEVNMHRTRNEPIVMKRNESYGKLETITDISIDSEYYFMYDYPNIY